MRFFPVLQQRHLSRLSAINQPVQMREIFVTMNDGSIGEYEKQDALSLEKDFSLLSRLKSEVFRLALLANEEHKSRNFLNGNIKEACVNCVTRLSTPECYFYTQNPLTSKQFLDLVRSVEINAKKISPNVHLLLSSFAVIDDHNSNIFNMGLYVQCGPEPKIDVFAKAHASSVDKIYPDCSLYQYPDNSLAKENLSKWIALMEIILSRNVSELKAFHYKELFQLMSAMSVSSEKMLELSEEILRKINLGVAIVQSELNALQTELIICSDKILQSNATRAHWVTPLVLLSENENGITVNHSGVVPVTTLGGAKFLVVPEICLDHRLGSGRNCLRQFILEASPTQYLPPRVSHIVTANTTLLAELFMLGDVVMFADAWSKMAGIVKVDKQGISSYDPPNSKVWFDGCEYDEKEKIPMDVLFFGQSGHVIFYPPYYLSQLPKEFNDEVTAHNQKVAKNIAANFAVSSTSHHYVPEQQLALALCK